MLYYIHHPSGNVVIRTTNPFIVLHYQHAGWCTTPSFPALLADHPEWRAYPSISTNRGTKPSLPARIFSGLLTSLQSTLALVPGRSPAGVDVVAPMLASSVEREDGDIECVDESVASGVIHWMTALERKWYMERGYAAPDSAWSLRTEGDAVFDFRLEHGICELERPPMYTALAKDETLETAEKDV